MEDQAEYEHEPRTTEESKDTRGFADALIDIIERKYAHSEECKDDQDGYVDGVFDAYDCIVDTTEFKMLKAKIEEKAEGIAEGLVEAQQGVPDHIDKAYCLQVELDELVDMVLKAKSLESLQETTRLNFPGETNDNR